MKRLLILLMAVMLVGCNSGSSSDYSEKQQKILEEHDRLDYANNDCEKKDSLKVMLDSDYNDNYIESYCALDIDKDDEGVNALLDAKLSDKEVQAYLDIDYVREKNIDRYLAYQKDNSDKKVKDVVLEVNLNLDEKPYEEISVIEGEDITMLVNKYNGLPEGYVPSDLVDINYTCTRGEDYSCADVDQQQLRKPAAEAYEEFVEAAKKEDLDIVAIASYRSYAYQDGLYSYNLNASGQEYADQYYARPGHSEHNSGLAVDITFNGYNFNEIENYDGYEWILENMHTYGFILRYPQDKEDITQYGYESWHLRYVGEELATYLYENDLTLDEYYATMK
ncbi:M15 family metallopeptidase [Breznakia pachnodae]|uniref:D-alanyl-D-alanine carboxypeptidase n=1 Tax=Breznakia pachnodae TaxID=265178 RepID=A0ABU0E0F6_9FIRM|nr:M15 family metallopeptidase [Breznakia pachnodae]MDQ0360035.1 D-alanyl-D-alanine carboxypeptidase [Breznakia pachnodae]